MLSALPLFPHLTDLILKQQYLLIGLVITGEELIRKQLHLSPNNLNVNVPQNEVKHSPKQGHIYCLATVKHI